MAKSELYFTIHSPIFYEIEDGEEGGSKIYVCSNLDVDQLFPMLEVMGHKPGLFCTMDIVQANKIGLTMDYIIQVRKE